MFNTVVSFKSNKLGASQASASYITSPIQSSQAKLQASPALAHMNYFLGGQLAFKGHACATKDFQVAKLNNTPCACCGLPMMTKKQNQEISKAAEGKAGEELINLLESNKKYFRGNEKAIVNYVIEQAKEDDMASIDMIIERGANADTHKIFNDEQKRVLNNVKSALYTNHCKDQEIFSYVDNNIITLNIDDSVFKRNRFLTELNQQLKATGNKELRNNVLDKAVQLPVSEKQIERFFEKHSKNSSAEKVMQRLLNPATVTVEHIKPESLGGKNNTANYLSECSECNGKRGNYNLNNYWMTNYPNMPESAQKNIDWVTENIVNGNLDSTYTDYPQDVQKSLDNETKGQIKLTVKTKEEIEALRKARGLN